MIQPRIAKLRKAVRLLRRPSWRRGLRYGVAATIEHWPLEALIRPRTVIDVGANKGQFTLFALEAFPECRVIAFEPLPSAKARFDALMAPFGNVRLIGAAIGPVAGRADLNVSRREDSSSLLEIGDKLGSVFPEAVSAGRTVTVRIGPLDSFVARDELKRPVLLKLDVQGFELEALKGCEPFFDEIDQVYVECSEIELYEKQALRVDVEAYLLKHDFWSVGQITGIRSRQHGLVQSDILFSRTGSSEGLGRPGIDGAGWHSW